MPRNHQAATAEFVTQAVEEAAAFVAARSLRPPRVGIILGTGLGNFVREIIPEVSLPYGTIPGFVTSTAVGHRGQLTLGTVGRVQVVVMEGRLHVYEGYAPWQLTLPVRVMHRLGINLLIVSNAAGAVNPDYRVGDVAVLKDHINLMMSNPLLGETNEALGPRWPDMSQPYDPELIEKAEEIARENNFTCHRGVYVGLSGPTYETRAEYRFLRTIGGDLVGMSTVPEVIVAAQLGLRVLALSTVTNVCLPDALGETDGDTVVDAATLAELKMRAIVLGILRDLPRG